jgi:hypothetical protein
MASLELLADSLDVRSMSVMAILPTICASDLAQTRTRSRKINHPLFAEAEGGGGLDFGAQDGYVGTEARADT